MENMMFVLWAIWVILMCLMILGVLMGLDKIITIFGRKWLGLYLVIVFIVMIILGLAISFVLMGFGLRP